MWDPDQKPKLAESSKELHWTLSDPALSDVEELIDVCYPTFDAAPAIVTLLKGNLIDF